MNEDVIIFSVFSSGKKRISSEFYPFERSLSFEGLLSPLERFLSFAVIIQAFIILDRHLLSTF